MRRLLALAAFVFLMGCSCARPSVPGVKPEPPTTIRFYPPAIYAHWWAEMETCTGFHGRMDRWQFRMAPVSYLREMDSAYVVAETRWPARIMVFTASRVLAERTVKHEFIHALGQFSHDYRVFVTACKVENDLSMRWQDNPINMPQ